MNHEIISYWIKQEYIIVSNGRDYYGSSSLYDNFVIAHKESPDHIIYYKYEKQIRYSMTEQDMLSFVRLQAFL